MSMRWKQRRQIVYIDNEAFLFRGIVQLNPQDLKAGHRSKSLYRETQGNLTGHRATAPIQPRGRPDDSWLRRRKSLR